MAVEDDATKGTHRIKPLDLEKEEGTSQCLMT
jgi:hypothetical protein